MNLTKSQPIHDATKAAPTRKIMNDDGIMITEKLPQNPNRRLMLTPAGNLSYLILSNSPVQRGRTQYGVEKMNEKIKRGLLPVNECPIARGYIKSSGEKPCAGDDGRGNFKNGKTCKHIKQIMRNRISAHNKTEEERARRMQNSSEVMKEYMQMKIKEEALASKIVEK